MEQTWQDDYDNLNGFEKLKLEQDGLDILEKLREYQNVGFQGIDPKELDLLKWAGVYVQRPKADGFFLMRVKIPSGVMTSRQARVIAEVARKYGRGVLDLTTRQAVQFHWITVEDLPEIMETLRQVGLHTIESCGDCPRTIIGNPLAGIDPDETLDTRGIVQDVFEHFQENREFSNLPRKFKISISANRYNAGHAQINDLAFTPALRREGAEEIQGFHVYVGGGLSAKPQLAQKLDLFVEPDEVLKVAIAVATLFRDYGYRVSRQHARLKFLLADWGAEKFTEEVLKLTGPMAKAAEDLTLGWNAGYFYGVHQQKQSGLNYAGLSIPVGRLTPEDLLDLANCAEQYGDGSLRTCNSKSLVLANIPDANVEPLLAEPVIERFSPQPKPFIGHTFSCTGKEFCNLALVETKNFALNLARTLDDKVELDIPLRIHVNGCRNSCAQLQIADIGLRGMIGKQDGETVAKFEFSLGGDLGLNPAYASPLEGLVAADRVHEVITKFSELYQAERLEEESFHSFVSRQGNEGFQEILNSYLD